MTARQWRALSRALRIWLYAAVIAVLAMTPTGAFPLDDAYITLANARALIEGNDPYYGVSPLVGATSPVHLAVVAAIGLLLPLTTASLVANLAALGLYAFGLDVLMRRMGATGWRVPLLVVTGLVGGMMPLQMLNGLETGLACATVAWLLVLADDRRLPWLAGVAPFVRPELGFLAGLLLIRRYWRRREEIIPAASIVLLVGLPWLLWMAIATGHIMPQTAEAKVLFFANWSWTLSERVQRTATIIFQSGFALLFLGLLPLERGGLVRILFVIGFIVSVMAITPDAIGWNEARYLAPTMPVLLAGVALMMRRKHGHLLASLICAGTLFWTPDSMAKLWLGRIFWAEEVKSIPQLLAAVPAGSTVLIHDAGIPAWSQPRVHLIDSTGLKTPSSIEWHRKFTRRECDLGLAMDGIVRSSGAQFALIKRDYPWPCIRTSLQAQGWTVDRVAKANSSYAMYRLVAPTSR